MLTEYEAVEICEGLNYNVAQLLGATRHDIEWSFDIKSTELGGKCMWFTNAKFFNKIRLDRELLEYPNALKLVVLHELCHAYDYDHSHHGKPWQRIAEKVGNAYHTKITRIGFGDEEYEKRKEAECEAKKQRLIQRPLAGWLINEEHNYKIGVQGSKSRYREPHRWQHVCDDGSRFPLKFVEATSGK